MCSPKHVAIQPVLSSSRVCALAPSARKIRRKAPAQDVTAQALSAHDVTAKALSAQALSARCRMRPGSVQRARLAGHAAKTPQRNHAGFAIIIDGGHACITPSHVFAHSHDPP